MLKKNVWVQTLILSGSLNIAFVAIFFYFLVRGNPLPFTFQPASEIDWESISLNTDFQSLSFDQLVTLLNDERIIEQGYCVRDLALGMLVAAHHLNLIEAVNRPFLKQKRLVFDETPLTIFPELNSQDYQNIIQFIRDEPWPFSSKGLFLEIKKEGIKRVDPKLVTFFCHRPEFIVLETLFARTHLPIQKKNVLAMVLEGGWDRIEKFFKEQEKASDFSEKTRRTFLLDYIEGGSQTAAHLLVVVDAPFAIQKLDDTQMIQVLDLLSVNTTESVEFVKTIATSKRHDSVCRRAERWLADFVDLSKEEVTARFYPRPGIGELRPTFRDQPPPSLPPQIHLIQPGESLWLIAQKYNVSIEVLMELNQLQSTVIHPGKTLKIRG